MNVDFLNPFLNSISNVLVTMASMDLKPGKIKMANDAIPPGDVTGVMTMSSPQVKGVVAISFSKAAALGVVRNMLGDELSEVDETVVSLVGEITNMTVGGAKQLLEKEGYDFDMAIPTVIVGRGQKIKFFSEANTIVIPFSAEMGMIYVEACFENI